MDAGCIADIRFSCRFPPNSPAALAAAALSGWKQVAIQVAYIPHPPAWILPQSLETEPILLFPLLRKYHFDCIWLFAEESVGAISKIQNVFGRGEIRLVPPPNSVSIEKSDNGDESIRFVPDPRDVLRHWQQRHRILSFGKNTPVAHRLVVF